MSSKGRRSVTSVCGYLTPRPIFGGRLIMMGQHDRSEALFYYFRLEDQIPETHLLRLIEKHISFAFVREQLKTATARRAARRFRFSHRWSALLAQTAGWGFLRKFDVHDSNRSGTWRGRNVEACFLGFAAVPMGDTR
jgi:hypothetical protein